MFYPKVFIDLTLLIFGILLYDVMEESFQTECRLHCNLRAYTGVLINRNNAKPV